MTDLEDTTDALLADPQNPALHHAVADRIAEESADPRRALLDLVIAAKQNDGPRLAYAVWCEANGQQDRTEFIRVQCELARHEAERPSLFHKCGPQGAGGQMVSCLCLECDRLMTVDMQLSELGWRQQQLLAEPRNFVNWMPSVMHTGSMAGIRYETGGKVGLFGKGFREAEFRRGFVESITCTAAAWLADGDAIAAAHPLDVVRLTTLPDVDFLKQIRKWPGIEFDMPD